MSSDDLVRPERHAVEEIDEAIAVRPERTQVARRGRKSLREAMAFCGADLGKARGEADKPATAAPLQSLRHIGHIATRCGDKGGVRGRRQFVHGAVVVSLGCGLAGRMDAPYGPTDFGARFGNGVGPGSPYQRYTFWDQESVNRP